MDDFRELFDHVLEVCLQALVILKLVFLDQTLVYVKRHATGFNKAPARGNAHITQVQIKQWWLRCESVPKDILEILYSPVPRLVALTVIKECSGIGHRTCIYLHKNGDRSGLIFFKHQGKSWHTFFW